MIPLHSSTEHAGRTIGWLAPDTEKQYQQNSADPDQRQLLQQFGWIDQHIKYSFNSHGFRTVEFDSRENFVAIGCSFTQGTGVHQHQRWTDCLSQQLDLWCWNLGVAGAASDTCYRIARYYLDVLKPKFVVFLEPRPNRMELHGDPGELPYLINWAYDVANWGGGSFVKTMLANDENLELRAEKNRAAIAYLCWSRNIPFFAYEPDAYLTCVDRTKRDLGRDLLHPGVENNRAFADFLYKDITNRL